MSASAASAAKVVFPKDSSKAAVPESLDDLLALAPAQLEELYAQASVPTIPSLSGDLRGRMLAWQGLSGPLAKVIQLLGSSNRFPWRGKSFSHEGELSGEGINRVLLDKWRLFKFTTFVGPSRGGAFDAVQLDYDHPQNPGFIRMIKDEVRQLRPGLYLGQAYLD